MKHSFLIPGRTLIFLLFFLGFLGNINAESKKDTLVHEMIRNRVKARKAQVIETQNASYLYYRPKPFQFLKYVPSDIGGLGKAAVAKKNLPYLGGLALGTGALILVDQKVTDAAQQFGRFINLDPSRRSKTLIEFNLGNFKVNAMEVPDNLNSAIYFLGEGWSSMLIAGSFYGYGLIANDYRALQVTSQITEVIFSLGLTTQFLKRITGRQSPFRVETDPDPVPGGKWHPFISPAKYQKSVSNYDAFPSGHMTTAVATLTIIAQNYPDSKLVKPVGITMLGLLGYSMINNGVHWISDYPLAVAIGYTAGKLAVSRGRKILPKIGSTPGSFSSLTPQMWENGALGLSYRAVF